MGSIDKMIRSNTNISITTTSTTSTTHPYPHYTDITGMSTEREGKIGRCRAHEYLLLMA